MSLKDLTQRILRFRDERNWKQFHTPKDMLLALGIEVSELSELFLWKNEAETTELLHTKREELGDELADILYWVLLAAHDFDVDLESAFTRKMSLNEAKYPVEKAKGRNTKYDKL